MPHTCTAACLPDSMLLVHVLVQARLRAHHVACPASRPHSIHLHSAAWASQEAMSLDLHTGLHLACSCTTDVSCNFDYVLYCCPEADYDRQTDTVSFLSCCTRQLAMQFRPLRNSRTSATHQPVSYLVVWCHAVLAIPVCCCMHYCVVGRQPRLALRAVPCCKDQICL